MIEAVDSYYQHVVSRMATINPNRQILGYMDAQGWPPQPVRFESFYLLTLGSTDAGKGVSTPAVPSATYVLQWAWVILGTDLTTGKVGRNRADRFRIEMQMRDELRQANYPLFSEKKSWSITGNSASSIQLVSSSLSPQEYIRWSQLSFRVVGKRAGGVSVGAGQAGSDQESGVMYGSASLSLTDITEMIAA